MESQEFEIFAKKLKELRAVEGLTQAKLAKKLNVSRSCLANYESRKRRPDDDMVKTIAEIFGVSVGYLTGKNQTPFPVDEGHEHDLDLSNILSSDGQLDISGVSPTAKIALIEFYNYLMDKAHTEPQEFKPFKKKSANDK